MLFRIMLFRSAGAYFKRFGPPTLALARFIVGVRLFASPLAGAGAIPYPQFLVYDFSGVLLWSAASSISGEGPGTVQPSCRLLLRRKRRPLTMSVKFKTPMSITNDGTSWREEG